MDRMQGDCASPVSPGDAERSWTGEQDPELTVLGKAYEFFQICDLEGKGFITHQDMQRLHPELPLSLEELEKVFVTLDADGNGSLTPKEFTTGFSQFLLGQMALKKEMWESEGETACLPKWEESMSDDEDEEHQFSNLMDRLGAEKVLKDENDVKQLWLQLRKDEPHLLSNFEEFLARIFSQFHEADNEKHELECALQKKIAAYDEEIQHLYEEMEQQIKKEKEQFILKDTERFQCYSRELECKLLLKEQELEQLVQKQKRLEGQCTELLSDKRETKVENTKLKQTNQELLRDLEKTSHELSLAQQQLQMLQEESARLHEEKEMEVYRVTETLQREKSGLLKQLDFLRERNKHLRDERDIFLLEERINSVPDHLFKIIFVGNSSVGKTSFLRRFCEDRFFPDTAATVGVDYSVKTVTVDNCQVALQLWDTAGQERYRSITKQFFRKADGVIVMYDITAKDTFTAVKQWLMSIEEATGENVPVLLLGNKTDNEKEREVPNGMGEHLAMDYNLIFYECSACSGHNTKKSMLHLASLILLLQPSSPVAPTEQSLRFTQSLMILKEHEDKVKEKTIQLQPDTNKKSCCTRP
ncbi:EF-hand calcium-binding domain-containing protein 4B isoform X3 [Apteryx rowi]|uniref:EF-hand calcium-binding domain-containing protein 4B isoform X3 n=1 Tax=Apteryx rowi TaxID=308060 RepID=UPI000E1CBA77|nr:EF-hand calcium-binding domain-containing protein 4B isoform X3 [Apteryx rowi]